MLSQQEQERYHRHIILPEFGEKAQLKLKKSKVLVIGAGGLGSPVLKYLTAAGVGTIGIVDDDKVSLHNLQRQVLYSSMDIGKFKVDIAKINLEELNPNVIIITHKCRFNSSNAADIAKKFDILVDCSDNFSTRYVTDDTSKSLNIPMVFASVKHYEGHVSVFNFKQGPSYRQLFPDPPETSENDETEKGILGVLPGIIGSIQANEAIKVLTGIGDILSWKLLIFNVLNNSVRVLRL